MRQILLVEDDPAILETLHMFLAYEGFDAVKARSVSQALEWLRRDRFDLVVLDYLLHDQAADPVIRAVRKLDTPRPKILLVTAAELSGDRPNFKDVDATVAKPFEIDVLLATLRRLIRPSFPNTVLYKNPHKSWPGALHRSKHLV